MNRALRAFAADLRRNLLIIGGPQALSTPVILSVVILGLIGTLVNTVLALGASLDLALLRYAVAAGTACLVMIAVRLTVLPVRPRPSRPGLVLFVYTVVSLGVLFLTQAFVPIPATDLDAPYDFVLLPFAISMMTLCGMAFVIGSRAQLRELRAQVEQRNCDLLRMQQEYEAEIRSASDALEHQVAASLATRLEEIDSTISRLDPEQQQELQDASRLLRSTVSDIVRPLSHALSQTERPGVVSEPTMNRDVRREEPGTESRVDFRAALRPGWATIVYAAVSLIGTQLINGDPVGSVIRALFSLLILMLLLGVRAVWPGQRALMPITMALPLLTGTYILVFLITRTAYRAFRAAVNPELPSLFSDASFLMVALSLGLALAISGILTERRRAAVLQLRSINAEIEIQNSRLRQEIWHLRSRLSRYLHGPMQSALMSASIALSQPDLDGTQLERLRISIQTVNENLRNFNDAPQTIQTALDESRDLWAGVCSIRTHLDPSLAQLIDSRPALARVVAEAYREAVSNATRHGRATDVVVRFIRPVPNLLEMVVTDNGRAADHDSAPGLGTSLFEEVSLSWTRTTDDDGTLLTLIFAL